MESVRTGPGRARPVLTATLTMLATCLTLTSTPAPAAPAATLPLALAPQTKCEVFPANNIWRADVSSLPVHPQSAAWLASMDAATTDLHPDFGPPDYGFPFQIVDEDTPRRRVRFLYRSESDRKRYPITKGTPIEGGSDRHALMIDRDSCKLYELFAVRWRRGRPRAGSGAIFDLESNALRPDEWTSADAAGLPIFPGLVRYDEVANGEIDHAIRFTAEVTRDQHVWPARHHAGEPGAGLPPMGAWFRLKAGFDMTAFSPRAQVILTAMKVHGMVLADNGSNWYFSGTRDRRWRNSLLDQLKTVPASAFEAVDVEGACMVSPNSAATSALC